MAAKGHGLQYSINRHNMRQLCRKLNKILSEKKEGFVDELNKLIADLYESGAQMYWDRDIFIDYNGDYEKMRELVKTTDKVKFEPSDDPTEHPGVVIRYKR